MGVEVGGVLFGGCWVCSNLELFGDNNITLWAMWKSVKPTTMQGFGNYCDQMKVDDTLTLRDTRDDNEYTIAKLKDNRCWMTQNLRLQNYELTSEDSDVKSTFMLPPSTDATDYNNYAFSQARVHIDSNNQYGGHYNMFATVAGEIPRNNYEESPYSICPKGWKLPTSDYYSTLYRYYATYSEIIAEPIPAFKQAGGYTGGNNYSYPQGTRGVYWSSTKYTYLLGFYLNDKSIIPIANSSANFDANLGWSIRCVVR